MKIKTVFGIILIVMLLAACRVTPNTTATQNSAPLTSDLQPEPTGSVLSDDLILRDEFDDDINKNWGMKIVSGLENQLI